MTDYERDMAAGGKPVQTGGQTDYERDLAAGAKPVDPETPWLQPGYHKASAAPQGHYGDDLAQSLNEARADALKSMTPGAGGTFVRHAVNAATFGLAGRAIDGPQNPADLNQQAERAGDAAHPIAATAGEVAGSVLPVGGPGLLAKAGGRFAEGALGRAAVNAGTLGRAGVGLAKGVLGYEASAPASAALRAGVEGGDPAAAAGDAAKNPVGLVAAGALGAAGGAAQGFAKSVRDPKSLTGRTIATVQKGGGAIRSIGEPVETVTENSVFGLPSHADLPNGKEGYNLAAARGGQAISRHNDETYKAAKAAFGEGFDAIAKDHPQQVDTSPVHARLDALAGENTASNGEVVDEGLAGALDKARRMLTWRVRLGDGFQEVPAAKFTDLKKAKTFLQDRAEFGEPPTAENRPYRLVYGEVAKSMEEIDPRIGQLNKQFADTVGKLERANDIIYRSSDASTPTGAGKEARAAGFLGRIGDETQAGTTNQLQYKELEAMDPAYARVIQGIEAKKAVERLRFGKPEMSMNIEKAAGSWLHHNLDAAKVRLALPGADRASGLTGVRAGLGANAAINPFYDLRQQERERDAKRAASVGGR